MRACGFLQRSLGAHLACAGALRLASLLRRGQPSTRLRVGDKTTRRTVGQSRGRARASVWEARAPPVAQCRSRSSEHAQATWLILPVVICLSQRLSHACLSISDYTVKLRMAH